MKDQLQAFIEQMHSTGILYSEAMRAFRRRFIQHVLERNHGNQCTAARELGMHRNTLARHLAELGMRPVKKRPASAARPEAAAGEVGA